MNVRLLAIKNLRKLILKYQLKSMSNYSHVSCDLHEQLKEIASASQECRLTHINQEGKLIRSLGQIVDIYEAEGADWCKLSEGSIIGFDRIETIEH